MEQSKNKKKLLACFAVSAVMVASLGLASCGGSSASSTAASASAASASASAASTASATSASASASSASASGSAGAVGEQAGFTELQVENTQGKAFEDVDAGPFSVSAVYFQPVPMSDGTTIEGYNLHLEADVAANLNNGLGIEEGLWVPYMSVDYKITNAETGAEAAAGTFMEMSATDGPHYGANVALPESGVYNIEFSFKSPQEQGYQLHTDAETGDGLSFDAWKNGPIVVTFENWDYIVQDWK